MFVNGKGPLEHANFNVFKKHKLKKLGHFENKNPLTPLNE